MSEHGRGELFIDDKLIDGVTGVSIHVNAGDINEIGVYLSARYVEVEGVFDVTTIGNEGVSEYRKAV